MSSPFYNRIELMNVRHLCPSLLSFNFFLLCLQAASFSSIRNYLKTVTDTAGNASVSKDTIESYNALIAGYGKYYHFFFQFCVDDKGSNLSLRCPCIYVSIDSLTTCTAAFHQHTIIVTCLNHTSPSFHPRIWFFCLHLGIHSFGCFCDLHITINMRHSR